MIRRCNKTHVTKDLQGTAASALRSFLDNHRGGGLKPVNLAPVKDVIR
jgi:hypothetical protein